MAITGGLGRVAHLEHEVFGPGQVGVGQGEPSVEHVEQAAVVERPGFADAVTGPAQGRYDLPVRPQRLLVAAEHGQDHRPFRFDRCRRGARGMGAVESADGIVSLAGQHQRSGQAEPGFSGQVVIAGPFCRLHRRPQVDNRFGDPLTRPGRDTEDAQGARLSRREPRFNGSVTSLDRQPFRQVWILGGQAQRHVQGLGGRTEDHYLPRVTGRALCEMIDGSRISREPHRLPFAPAKRM